MSMYMEISDRYYYDNRLEKLAMDGISEAPAFLNFYTLDCIVRCKYIGKTRDVFIIIFKYKNDTDWSYCKRFSTEYARDAYFNRLRRKLMARKSKVKKI